MNPTCPSQERKKKGEEKGEEKEKQTKRKRKKEKEIEKQRKMKKGGKEPFKTSRFSNKKPVVMKRTERKNMEYFKEFLVNSGALILVGVLVVCLLSRRVLSTGALNLENIKVQKKSIIRLVTESYNLLKAPEVVFGRGNGKPSEK